MPHTLCIWRENLFNFFTDWLYSKLKATKSGSSAVDPTFYQTQIYEGPEYWFWHFYKILRFFLITHSYLQLYYAKMLIGVNLFWGKYGSLISIGISEMCTLQKYNSLLKIHPLHSFSPLSSLFVFISLTPSLSLFFSLAFLFCGKLPLTRILNLLFNDWMISVLLKSKDLDLKIDFLCSFLFKSCCIQKTLYTETKYISLTLKKLTQNP